MRQWPEVRKHVLLRLGAGKWRNILGSMTRFRTELTTYRSAPPVYGVPLNAHRPLASIPGKPSHSVGLSCFKGRIMAGIR